MKEIPRGNWLEKWPRCTPCAAGQHDGCTGCVQCGCRQSVLFAVHLGPYIRTEKQPVRSGRGPARRVARRVRQGTQR